MAIEWWLAFMERAGAVAAVLEFGALWWLNADRNRVVADLKVKSAEVTDLAKQVITVATELRVFLFNERKNP